MSESARSEPDTPVVDPEAVVTHAWRAAAERGAAALALVGNLPVAAEPFAEDDAACLRIAWANPAALELLGLGHGELDGVALLDAAPRSRRGQAWPLVTSSLLRGAGGHGVGVVRRPDESTQRVQVQVVPLEGGWLVTLTPHVDEARAARTAAAEADHRFRALAEHAPVGIFLSEAGLRLGYVNRPFADLLGTDPGVLTGTSWVDAIHPDDRPELLEALQAVLAGQTRDVRVRLAAPLTSRVPVPSGEGGPAATRPSQRWLHLRLAPTTTPSRAAGFVGTAEDVTSRRAWEEQMSYQAQHDPLTGLVNRRRLVADLTDLLASRRGPDHAFAVLFFDLDGFKEINDSYGHAAGDRVLVEVARRMQRTAREYDVIARIAGDEFVVVLRNVRGPDEAEAAGRRHLAALCAPLTVAGREVVLSSSLGIAMPSPNDTPETLLRAADHVMYDAKAAGPGTYRVAPPALGHPTEATGDEAPERRTP